MASFSNLGFEDPKSQSAMRGANPENFTVLISGHAIREPRRMIYIHTVAKRTFPPLARPLFPKLTLRGCERGERHVMCAAIPDPVAQAVINEMNAEKDIKEHDGWRASIDLLNPSNLTSNPFSGDQNPDFYANRSGQNLIAEGFWPSLHRDPPEAEIKAAEERRDRHYKYLTREATRLAAISAKELNEFIQSYPDVHIAMDALGMEAPWHARSVVRATCPNCGDLVAQGIAFHQSSAGILCVIDPARAFKAGAINRERYEDLITAPDEPAERRGPGRPRKEF